MNTNRNVTMAYNKSKYLYKCMQISYTGTTPLNILFDRLARIYICPHTSIIFPDSRRDTLNKFCNQRTTYMYTSDM